ncbi:MAG: hypothetical protein CTY15_10410 [Methylocystis sp.]|nr:MAG: hypothetical protein CTY15_10410 [Methylocystis sp.]
MDFKKLSDAASPKKLGAYLAKRAEASHGHGSHAQAGSERSFEHAGHKVTIATTYEVRVDGKPLAAPLGVDEAGQVHCHSLPNYQTASAVDMVKYLIDIFPDEFQKKARAAKKPATRGKTSKR